MKVLLITNGYLPTSVGGTEMSTHTIAQALQGASHQVQVLCTDNWGEGPQFWNGASEEIYEGIPVTRLQINWRLAPDPCQYLYRNPKVAAYLHQYLLSTPPDVVHVTSCVNMSASVLTTTASLGVPLVLTLTDFWFICPRIKLIKGNGEQCDGHVTSWECLKCMLWDAKAYRWPSKILPEPVVAPMLKAVSRYPFITRYRGFQGMAFDIDHRRVFLKEALQQCDRIIVKSRYMLEFFTQHAIPSDKFVILPDGEDTSWKPSRSNNNLSDIMRVGYVGHIIPMKGVHVLIKAMQQLNGRVELFIFGDLNHDPAYTNSLRRLANEDNRIHFQGGFPHHRIAEVFSQIDVLVVPSVWPETFCHVIREGFIGGVPVIGANIGAIPEAIDHGKNGFLFSPDDANELGRYLQMIIDDPNILKQLKTQVPEVKTVEQQVQELVSLYESIWLE